MISRKGLRRQLKWKESKGGTPKLNSWGIFFGLKEMFETLKTIYLLVNLQKNTGWFSSYLLADLKSRKISLNNYLNYLQEEAFFSLIACERSLCRRSSNILSLACTSFLMRFVSVMTLTIELFVQRSLKPICFCFFWRNGCGFRLKLLQCLLRNFLVYAFVISRWKMRA